MPYQQKISQPSFPIQVRPEKSYLIMDDSFATSGRDGATRVPFINSRPLTCWAEDDLGIEICIAPVLVCSQVLVSCVLVTCFYVLLPGSADCGGWGQHLGCWLGCANLTRDIICCHHQEGGYITKLLRTNSSLGSLKNLGGDKKSPI